MAKDNTGTWLLLGAMGLGAAILFSSKANAAEPTKNDKPKKDEGDADDVVVPKVQGSNGMPGITGDPKVDGPAIGWWVLGNVLGGESPLGGSMDFGGGSGSTGDGGGGMPWENWGG